MSTQEFEEVFRKLSLTNVLSLCELSQFMPISDKEFKKLKSLGLAESNGVLNIPTHSGVVLAVFVKRLHKLFMLMMLAHLNKSYSHWMINHHIIMLKAQKLLSATSPNVVTDKGLEHLEQVDKKRSRESQYRAALREQRQELENKVGALLLLHRDGLRFEYSVYDDGDVILDFFEFGTLSSVRHPADSDYGYTYTPKHSEVHNLVKYAAFVSKMSDFLNAVSEPLNKLQEEHVQWIKANIT